MRSTESRQVIIIVFPSATMGSSHRFTGEYYNNNLTACWAAVSLPLLGSRILNVHYLTRLRNFDLLSPVYASVFLFHHLT